MDFRAQKNLLSIREVFVLCMTLMITLYLKCQLNKKYKIADNNKAITTNSSIFLEPLSPTMKSYIK